MNNDIVEVEFEEVEKKDTSATINAVQGLAALSEATVDSLSEVFSRNPLEMSPEDIRRVVDELRKMRARWAIAEMAGKKSLPKTTTTQKALPKPSEPKPPADMEF